MTEEPECKTPVCKKAPIPFPKPDLFLSFDIESDGPSPAINNMLSIGIVGITMEETIVFEYEANMEPLEGHIPDETCMNTFWRKPKQILAWDHLQRNRRNYRDVFEELSTKFNELASIYNLRFVAYPACFDWMFLKCYYELAKQQKQLDDPDQCLYDIGYRCECASTLWDTYKTLHHISNKHANQLFKEWGEFNERSNHMALADATVQGKVYIRVRKALPWHAS